MLPPVSTAIPYDSDGNSLMPNAVCRRKSSLIYGYQYSDNNGPPTPVSCADVQWYGGEYATSIQTVVGCREARDVIKKFFATPACTSDCRIVAQSGVQYECMPAGPPNGPDQDQTCGASEQITFTTVNYP